MNINILPQNDCIVNLFLQKNLLKNSYFFHFFINLRKKPQKVEKNRRKSLKLPKTSFFPFVSSFSHIYFASTPIQSPFSRVIIYNVETICRRMQVEKLPASL